MSGLACSASATSNPSISGIETSLKTTSGRTFSMSATHAAVLRELHLVRGRSKRGLNELPDHRVVLADDDLGHDAARAPGVVRASPRGRFTWKTDPSPTVLSAQTVPPWSCTI